MQNTHHIVGGRRSPVKADPTTFFVFTGAVPTVRVSNNRGLG